MKDTADKIHFSQTFCGKDGMKSEENDEAYLDDDTIKEVNKVKEKKDSNVF